MICASNVYDLRSNLRVLFGFISIIFVKGDKVRGESIALIIQSRLLLMNKYLHLFVHTSQSLNLLFHSNRIS